jgi:type IV secretory pathway protease TraF
MPIKSTVLSSLTDDVTYAAKRRGFLINVRNILKKVYAGPGISVSSLK